jgi:cytochrome c oxidase cbb3-type subunit 4
MESLASLYPLLKTIWVVWFFVLFLGMLAWVFRPGRRDHYRRLAEIPFHDERRAGRL